MAERQNDIELNSEEFQEILSKTPSWVLRSGITIVLLIVVLFLVGSALFRYPDVIQASAKLTGTMPPARIKAVNGGILTEIYVANNQQVEAGDYLAVIQNPARVEDVRYLKAYLNNYTDGKLLGDSLPRKELKLGALQSSYSACYQAMFEYKKYREYNYPVHKMDAIREQYGALDAYSENLRQQKGIVAYRLELMARGYSRDSLLYRQELVSLESFEQSEMEYLSGKLDLENINSSLSNAEAQKAQLMENYLDAENSFRETENNYLVTINNLVSQLRAEINSWELNFVLVAPVGGRLSFNNYWARNQNVVAGEEIFSIVPADSGVLMAKAYVQATRYGKVRQGQQANIRLENFPDTEFGILEGVVNNISKVPSLTAEGGYYYTVDIALPAGLTTSYKRELPYYPEMSGVAEIVTNDMSLLERIFLPIRKVFAEGFKSKK